MVNIENKTAISLQPGQHYRKDSRHNWRKAEEVANMEGKKAFQVKGEIGKTPVHYIIVNRSEVFSPYQDIQIKTVKEDDNGK